MDRWAIGVVESGREAKAAAALAGKGCEVWLPTVVKWIKPRSTARARKPIPIQVAALPGYLFLRDLPDDPDIIYFMPGFYYLMRYKTDELVWLTEEELSEIREVCEDYSRPEGPSFKLWERVRVSQYPWDRVVGQIAALERGRAWINAEGFRNPLSVPLAMLERI